VGIEGFDVDGFVLRQLWRPVMNVYEVYRPGASPETPGQQIAYARQRRMKIKEEIHIFRDDAEREELFRIKARSAFDMAGAVYDVLETDGTPIGTLAHRFKQSLLKTTWAILDPQGTELLRATEANALLAILRRVKELVPYAGFVPIPYNFLLLAPEGRELGHYKRLFKVRDEYVLELPGDPQRSVDRRLLVALAIALDALQNR
jgi:uncharacterized protein YxjI